MCNICARLYLFPQLRKIVLLSPLRNTCVRFAIYAQNLCKIVLISPAHNIRARFAQDCTSFSNPQYMGRFAQRFYFISQMRNICTRLYLFLQCAIQGVPKDLLASGEQCIVGSPFNFVFIRVSDKTQNKCSKNNLFKSTIKLNNFSSDKKHNL